MITEEELWALESLGHFYLVRGRNGEARSLFDSLVLLAPERGYAWFALGLLAKAEEDPATACRHFANAVQRCDDPRFVLALAEAHLALCDREPAVKLLHLVAGTSTSCAQRAAAILRHLQATED